jgi:hypothetical protein
LAPIAGRKGSRNQPQFHELLAARRKYARRPQKVVEYGHSKPTKRLIDQLRFYMYLYGGQLAAQHLIPLLSAYRSNTRWPLALSIESGAVNRIRKIYGDIFQLIQILFGLFAVICNSIFQKLPCAALPCRAHQLDAFIQRARANHQI